LKESFADKVLAGVNKRVDIVVEKIVKDYANVKPFDTRKMTDRERLDMFDGMNVDDIGDYQSEYGDEALYSYVAEMEALRRKLSAK